MTPKLIAFDADDTLFVNETYFLEIEEKFCGLMKKYVTHQNISDELFSIVPAISWRPTAQTVIRLNYRFNWQKDLLGNPPSKLAGIQFGLSAYF